MKLNLTWVDNKELSPISPRYRRILRRESNALSLEASSNRYTIAIAVRDDAFLSEKIQGLYQEFQSITNFNVIIFGDKILLDTPIKQWPKCDFLIAFYSDGYPLDRITIYYCFHRLEIFAPNHIPSMRLFTDRRLIIEILMAHNVAGQEYIIISRDGGRSIPSKPKTQTEDVLEEHDDYIVFNGYQLEKPFIERSTNPSDSLSIVYYHSKDGGGAKVIEGDPKLFQNFTGKIRREGSYIYERYLDPDKGEVVDIRAYCVDHYFQMGEMRSLSTNVQKSKKQCALSPEEAELATQVCYIFRQKICGVDLHRTNRYSYVQGIEGWALADDYFIENAARITKKLFLDHLKKRERVRRFWVEYPTRKLVGSIAIYRSANRVPSQKITLLVSKTHIAKLNINWSQVDSTLTFVQNSHKFQSFLEILQEIENKYNHNYEEMVTEFKVPLIVIKQTINILRASNSFIKINTNPDTMTTPCQRNPWSQPLSQSISGTPLADLFSVAGRSFSENPDSEKVEVTCRNEPELTDAGKKQAFEAGFLEREYLISQLVDGKWESCQEKLWNSVICRDFGCTNVTATYFAKGLLGLRFDEELEKPVTIPAPTKTMLDPHERFEYAINTMRRKLHQLIHREEMTDQVMKNLSGTGVAMLDSLRKYNDQWNPLNLIMGEIYEDVKILLTNISRLDPSRVPVCANGETLDHFQSRWKAMFVRLFNRVFNQFDTSLLSSLLEFLKYDIAFNRELVMPIGVPLFWKAKMLGEFYIPREYGITPEEKYFIGANMCAELNSYIMDNINEMIGGKKPESTFRFIFTTQGSLQCLFNLLVYSNTIATRPFENIPELGYMSHVIFNVWENTAAPSNHDEASDDAVVQRQIEEKKTRRSIAKFGLNQRKQSSDVEQVELIDPKFEQRHGSNKHKKTNSVLMQDLPLGRYHVQVRFSCGEVDDSISLNVNSEDGIPVSHSITLHNGMPIPQLEELLGEDLSDYVM